MALVCPADLTGIDYGFEEFLDCSTLNINYDLLGNATLTFTVVSVNAQPNNPSLYTDLTFGGVNFTGFITSLEVRRIDGTLVYEHRYTITGVGCRV